jgi:hypothetical protein
MRRPENEKGLINLTDYFDGSLDENGDWQESEFEKDNGSPFDEYFDDNSRVVEARAIAIDKPLEYRWVYIEVGEEWPCEISYHSVGLSTGVPCKADERGGQYDLFEGDIIKYEGKVYEIAFFREMFVVSTNYTLRPHETVDYIPLHQLDWGKIELLSTIHEHPELLKGGLPERKNHDE